MRSPKALEFRFSTLRRLMIIRPNCVVLAARQVLVIEDRTIRFIAGDILAIQRKEL
ncbi:MAG: hypothetical protein IPI41_16680 [Flavobacteriales bacterium]|nr:hypothetical protein [Flavobacteriales bacterium]